MQGVTVGVLSPFLAGSYFGALIDVVTRVVSKAGGRVVAVQTARPGMEPREGSATDPPSRVAWEWLSGFIVIGGTVSPGYVRELHRAGKAVVVVGHDGPGMSCPAVLVDNRGGTKQAVEHLLWHGHRRIAFVGCMELFDVRERYDSYCETLVAHGIEPDPGLCFEAGDSVEFGGIEAGKRLVAAGLPSTAAVVATDLNAVGVAKALGDAGYCLPQDQALTGFDNIMGSALLTPALSTVSQDVGLLGAKAAELLLRELSGSPVRAGRHLVEAPFVVRESCGCKARSQAAGAGVPGKDLGEVSRALGELSWEAPKGVGAPGELAAQVAGVLSSAVEREPAREDLDRLEQACEGLFGARPSQSTRELVVAFAEQLSARLGGGRAEAARRLERCLASVELGLTKAALRAQTDAYYAMRRAVREQYLCAVDLLGGRQDDDPHSLGWLGRTEALAAVLGLWRRGPGAGGLARAVADPQDNGALAPSVGPPKGAPGALGGAQPGGTAYRGPLEDAAEICVASTYGLEGSAGLEGSCRKVESFPPEELFGAVGEGCVTALIPISSERANWGLLAIVAPVDPVGQDTYLAPAALFTDVLDRQALTSSLLRSEERYALAVRAANDGLWDWDLETGKVYYSQRWKEMLGYPGSSIGDSLEEWLGRVHEEDRPRLVSELAELEDGRRDKFLFEHRLRARDGSYLWVLCRALAVPGGGAPAGRVVGSITDVSGQHALEEQLRRQALYDSLTGLPNRALFIERLSQALVSAKRRPGYSFAVLWLDLDNFKDLNDTRGHLAGDELLVQVAGRLRKDLRSADTAARFGGDEFAVLLVDVPEPAVHDIAERVMDDLRAPYRVGGEEFVVTASLGVVLGTEAYERPEDVLRDADIAMYRAKSAGRGSSVTFSPLLARRAS